MDTFNYFEYIEKIILKSHKIPNYEIFVLIPVEDLMNKKTMKAIFGDNDDIYKRIKVLIKEIESHCIKYSNMRFNMFKFNSSLYIGYSYNESFFIFSCTFRFCKFNEESYITLIKKIGSYYNWKDEDEKLTDNIEKKQLTLFSLLFNKLVNN